MGYPSNSESVAQDQIKSFVDRIIRLREEAKAINDDIREIYAEAKANGFDKTVLGKLVLYVERRAKDSAAVLEGEAIFDLYLEAYYGSGTENALAHTHEKPAAIEPPSLAAPAPEDARTVDSGGTQSQPDAVPQAPSGVGPATSPAGAEGDADRHPNSAAAEMIAQRKKLRPHCLRPHNCGGMGHNHCFSCNKAHADAEGLSA